MGKSDHIVSVEEEPQKVTIKYGVGTIFYRFVMFLMVVGAPVFVGGAIYYADGHNDQRYVGIHRYEADRRYDALKEDELQKKLAHIEMLLREQGGDIKQLIRK